MDYVQFVRERYELPRRPADGIEANVGPIGGIAECEANVAEKNGTKLAKFRFEVSLGA